MMQEAKNFLEDEDFDEDEDERELIRNLEPVYLAWQEETLQKGRDEGKAEAQCEIALNLLKSGMSCEQVMQVVGLSMESMVLLAEKKGKAEAQYEIALNLLKVGMENYQVEDVTGLSIKLVRKLAREMGNA
jgi:predicted transposase YdaD